MKCKILLATLLLLNLNSQATVESVMLGAVNTREAKIWVKAKPNALVEVKIKELTDFLAKEQADEFGISKFAITNLSPDTTYSYSVSDSDSTQEAQLKTLGEFSKNTNTSFSVAVLGRNFVKDELDSQDQATPEDYDIYDQVLKLKPLCVIWANGIDTLRESDYFSKSGYYTRFIHSRTHEKLQNLLKGTSNIGVMAIDNYGSKKADATMFTKEIAQNAFMNFWANPTYGNSKAPSNAMYTQFRINDAEFFIVDDCSFRDNFEYKNKKRSFLGSGQLNALVQALFASEAKWKVIVMNTAIANPNETYNNYSDAKSEKATLFERIEGLKIKGVICVSANKEYAEITKMIRSSSYPIYDITAGPLTAKTVKSTDELNYFKVPNSQIFQKTFTILNFSGEADKRILYVGFIDSKGALKFKHPIPLSEISE